jgi:serine protease Do
MSRPALGLTFFLVAFVSAVAGLVLGGGGRTAAPVAGPPSFADIAARVNPSVVHVAVLDPAADPHADPDDQNPLDAPQRGEGSGFVVDDEGYILTNHHVVNGATRIRVRLADQRQVPARLIGTDASTDVALIKIEPQPGIKPSTLGDSDSLRVGEWVCAIGNPLGFDHSVTAGVVSSKGRKIWDASFDSYIQTDAAINPGNSGGPLLNTAGEVVGISSAMSREGQGIGFAVPINLAREVMRALRSNGRVQRGYLGVQLDEVDGDMRALLGLKQPGGALIVDVVAGGTGESAGLKRYDVVLAVGGQRISGGDELVHEISGEVPGTHVTLAVFRDGHELALNAQVGERHEVAATPSPRPSPSGPAPDPLGLSVGTVSVAERKKLKLPRERSGVVVEDLVTLSPGADALQDGDLVTEINRQPTPDVASYTRVLGSLRPGSMAVLYVYRPETGESFLTKLEVEAR